MGTGGGMRALRGPLVRWWRRLVSDGEQRHCFDQGETVPYCESTFGKDPLRRPERTGIVGDMPSRDDCGPLKPLSTQAFLRYADLERHHPGALSGELGDEAHEKRLVHADPSTFGLRSGTLSSSEPRLGVLTVLEERQFEAHVPMATLRGCPERWCSRGEAWLLVGSPATGGGGAGRMDQAQPAMTLTRRLSPWRARWPST
jgi:hypothetical protein